MQQEYEKHEQARKSNRAVIYQNTIDNVNIYHKAIVNNLALNMSLAFVISDVSSNSH